MEKQNFKDIYSEKNFYKLVLPFSEALLSRINLIFNMHSNLFQKVIHYTNNNFEIIVWLERLNTSKSIVIGNLKESKIKKLFIQFIIIYEIAKKLAIDFIDFEKFIYQYENLKFPICIKKKCEIKLSYIFDLLITNKFFKDLNHDNYYEIFKSILNKQRFDENSYYFYKYSDFASNILNLFEFDHSQNKTNLKILVKTENKIQKKIIETNIVQHLLHADVFLLNKIGKSDSLQKIVCKFFFNKINEIDDFDSIIELIDIYLSKSIFKSLVLLIDTLENRKDIEFVKYLMDYSNLTNITLIIFNNNDFLDFDFILNEKPENLLKKYFIKNYKERNTILSKSEIYILKIFFIIFIPIPIIILHLIFNKNEINSIDHLISKKYIHSNSTFVSLRNSSVIKGIKITFNEELKILRKFLDHMNSSYVKIKYLIKIKNYHEIKVILSDKLFFDNNDEYKYFEEIKSILLNNINSLSDDIELLKLLTIMMIKERDLKTAKFIIQKFKARDHLFFYLKLAFIYKLEKEYIKMESILIKLEKKISICLSDEYCYLKFIFFEKTSDFNSADIYLRRIKNKYYICLSNLQLSDRLIYNGEFEKAKNLLNETIDYLKQENCYSDELEAYSHLAKLLREEGDYNSAEKIYKNIYIKCEIRNYDLLSAFIGVDIGNYYLRLDDFSRAEFWYFKALKVFRAHKNSNGEILVESNLVEINKIKGNWTEAEIYLKSILKYDRDKKLITSLAIDLYNVGHLEYLRRNYPTSLEFVERSLKIFLSNNHLNGIIECVFLKLFINFIQNLHSFNFSVIKKYWKQLNHDQRIIFSIFEKVSAKYFVEKSSLLINDVKALESKISRFNLIAIIIEKLCMNKYLKELKLLSKELSKRKKNYYYYEYYWVFFNILDDYEGLKTNEREIFVEMYYFFLRNKRTFTQKIITIKKKIDEQNSIKDFFKSVELVGKYLNWKIPEDFFSSFLNELTKKIAINFIKLKIFKNKEPIFNFSDSSKYEELSQEIISQTILRADPLNLTLKEIQKEMQSPERFFFPYKNTKVYFWNMSENIFAILLMAFNTERYYNVDIYENFNDLFFKFGSLFSRFYEYEYAYKRKLNFIIGESIPIKILKKKIVKVSKVDFSLLITGESGSGKELVAKAVHLLSKRSKNPFVPVNYSAIPDNLLEAELFGYKKGAFTGANENRIGLIESANMGTLFLDEIGDIPLYLQGKLLRVLQENEIRRLGDNTIHKVDIRLISATNKSLSELINRNQFREDLYFRIQDLTIRVPSLRERMEDISLLIQHFFKKYGFVIEDEIELNGIIEHFKSFRWQGNIRELESHIKRLITFYPDLDDNSFLNKKFDMSLKNAKAEFEKSFIMHALNKKNWNKVQTAEQLKISRVYLFDLIKKYKIKKED